MTVSFTFFQELTIMRSIFNALLRVHIVDLFQLGCHPEALQPPDSSGILVSVLQSHNTVLSCFFHLPSFNGKHSFLGFDGLITNYCTSHLAQIHVWLWSRRGHWLTCFIYFGITWWPLYIGSAWWFVAWNPLMHN